MHDDPSALDHELDAFGRHIRGAADRRQPLPNEVRARARSVRARRRAASGGSVVVAATVLGSAALWQRHTPEPAPIGALALTGPGTVPGSAPSSVSPSSVVAPTPGPTPPPTPPPSSPTTVPGATPPPTTGAGPAITAPPSTVPPSRSGERFAWPVEGTIGDGFTIVAGRGHEGLDIVAPTGTPVRAAQSGRVTVAGRSDGYGNLVVIEHAGGLSTRYAHLSVVRVAVGDAVTAGQVIGEVGMTGNTTGPVLHFEVRRGDVAEDPLAHLP